MAIYIKRCGVSGRRSSEERQLVETWWIEIDKADADAKQKLDPLRILNNSGGDFAALPADGTKYNAPLITSNSLGVIETEIDEELHDVNERWRREVRLTYGDVPLVQGVNAKPIGEVSADPNDWSPKVELNAQLVPLISHNALFLGYFEQQNQSLDPCHIPTFPQSGDLASISNSYAELIIGNNQPVINTAGIAFDDGVDIGRIVKSLKITKYFKTVNVNGFECYENQVNDRTTAISVPSKGFVLVAQKHELWLQTIQALPRYIEYNDATTGNKVKSHYYDIVFEFLYQKGGHYVDVANTSTRRGVSIGDANDRGGAYDADDFKGNTVGTVATRGPDKIPEDEPRFLSADGKSFMPKGNSSYLRYLGLYEANFKDAALGLDGLGVSVTV